MSYREANQKRNSILGFFVGSLLGLVGKPSKTSVDDLKRLEFKNSTQRLGVSFTDRIRNIFRNRWLKKS
jgi:hypothetical protein